MIDYLKISNFMAFEKLEIPALKRVNLIAGKNNSGKTTLLDAIRIYAAFGDQTVINNILFARESFTTGWTESYNALFNKNPGKKSNILIINDFELERKNKGHEYFFEYLSEDLHDTKKLDAQNSPDYPKDKVTYVPFQSNFKKLSELWDNIVLTPKEDDVYKILRETVEPKLIRFDVGSNKVRVRLDDTKKPVPLGTLGDGVNRVLLIALSLANAQNSYLLIDELELGLHYSAMEKLWEMIFKYAIEWNIQVFATTHSQDAIRAFHYVASEKEEYVKQAEYIRLQLSRKRENEAIIFDGDRLKDSLNLQLEIR